MKKTLKTTALMLMMSAGSVLAMAHVQPTVSTGEFQGETFLMDGNKMTLYTFDKDTKGASNCYDACAEKWPPLLGEEGMELPKKYKLIDRKDGTKQVAYKGHPLYLWIKDAKPGDMTGDGVKGVWHIARP